MKFKASFCVIVLLLSTMHVFAQVQSCEFGDPDFQCPLDNWVIVLAVAASVFAMFKLYRRRNPVA